MFPSAFLHTSQARYTFRKKVQVLISHSLLFGLHKYCFGFVNFLEMAPHTGSATPEQIDALLNFLDEHKDLARGRLRGGEGNAEAKRLWEKLCNNLNSMGGCTKTIQQWQKVWFDRKHLAKKAAADSRRLASVTGGPSLAPPLSHWQLKVLSIMGEGFGGCQTTTQVPAFSEINEPMPSTSSQASQPFSFSQSQLSLNLPEDIVEYANPSQDDRATQHLEPTSQPLVSHESLISRSFSQPTRPRRRRQSPAGCDVRRRLLQYEEEHVETERIRNTELVGIRAALEQLCGLIREHLDSRNLDT